MCLYLFVCETKHIPFLKPQRFFRKNLNKKLSQHRRVEGEVGNHAKANFRDTRVLGQLHRECLRYSTVFVDVIRGRQSSRFAHWIMKEGPENGSLIPLLSELLGSGQDATLFADPRDLRLDTPTIDFKSLNVISPPETFRINQKYVLYTIWNTPKSSSENIIHGK